MRNNHIFQQDEVLEDNNAKDTMVKLVRLVRLLATQEALDVIKKTGTIASEVQS